MSKDHSRDIRSCVQILQNNAVAAAISKEKARSSRTIEILRKNVLSLIEEDDLDHALLQDMDFWHSPEETDETIPPKKKARLQPSPNITDCSPMNMQTLPTVKVGKKMEKRSGKDVITDQASFRRMRNTKDKLDFIVQHADKDTGKYINSHRCVSIQSQNVLLSAATEIFPSSLLNIVTRMVISLSMVSKGFLDV